jgi:hypothetical protein
MTRRSLPGACLATLLLAAPAVPAENLPFPLRGGPAAFDRLLGHVATEPDRFVHSLNRVLLEQVNPQHAWDQVERRKELMQLVEDLAAIERRLGRSIELAGSKPGRKRFEQLCAELGYGARWKDGEWMLVAKPGDGAVRGQRLARALGWDLTAIGREAEAGTVTLEIPIETVELPLSEAEWRAITDRSAPIGDPLEALIEDQRLGLVIEGRRRLSAETLAALDAVGWHWLYRHGEPFVRYAPALRFRGGRLALPGGPAADRAWTSLLGTSPAGPAQLVRDLLDNRGARGAFLVHALSYQPDHVVHFYLGAGDATTSDESRFGRQVFRRVDETTRVDFDAAHGGDLGFGTLVRSLPLDPETGGPRLPGGLGLWYVAIRSADAPTDRQALARTVRRGEERRLTESEFLLAALTEQNDVLGVKRSALPRLIRTAQVFGGREELLTPENVLLLARLSDTAPAALPSLETLEPSDAEAVTDVLLAVAHLSTLKPSADHELLLAQFQGGLEWIAAMARADRVEQRVLEGWLQSWARLHQGADDPHLLAGRQLGWIVEVLAGLPEAPEGAPGRDDAERRMVQALVAADPELGFEYAGIEYRSRRHELLATAMARHLERQGIPSAGELTVAARRFHELREAASSGAVEEARSTARELASLIGGWAVLDFEMDRSLKDLWPRVAPVDRETLLAQLGDVERAKKRRRPAPARRRGRPRPLAHGAGAASVPARPCVRGGYG